MPLWLLGGSGTSTPHRLIRHIVEFGGEKRVIWAAPCLRGPKLLMILGPLFTCVVIVFPSKHMHMQSTPAVNLSQVYWSWWIKIQTREMLNWAKFKEIMS